MDLYPSAKEQYAQSSGDCPALAVINHCAELQLCPPLRMKRFKVDTKIKKPVTLEWINAFRANADRLDVGVLALFLFATGARISEALGCPDGATLILEVAQCSSVKLSRATNGQHMFQQTFSSPSPISRETESPSPSPTPQPETHGTRAVASVPVSSPCLSTVAGTASLLDSTTKE
jgi:hypothetical protein